LISVKADDKRLQGKIDNMVNKQIMFAASVGLSEATTKARDTNLKDAYEKTFKMRDKQFFKLTHAVARSSIGDAKRSFIATTAIKGADAPRIAGTVGGSTRKAVDTSFMNFHVTGGTRRALKTKKAVPITKGVTPPLKITRTKTGKVTKAKKASTLYPKDTTFVKGAKSGNSTLMVRTGKRTIRAAYTLTPEVKNRKKYNPLRAVRKGVLTRFEFEYKKALIRGIKTARPITI